MIIIEIKPVQGWTKLRKRFMILWMSSDPSDQTIPINKIEFLLKFLDDLLYIFAFSFFFWTIYLHIFFLFFDGRYQLPIFTWIQNHQQNQKIRSRSVNFQIWSHSLWRLSLFETIKIINFLRSLQLIKNHYIFLKHLL